MTSTIKSAAMIAAVVGLLAVSACEELAAVGQGVLIACQDNPVGCDEVFFTGTGPPPPLDADRR